MSNGAKVKFTRVFKAKNKIYTPENALKLCKYAAFIFRKNSPFTIVLLGCKIGVKLGKLNRPHTRVTNGKG